jgi:hypothetical protein
MKLNKARLKSLQQSIMFYNNLEELRQHHCGKNGQEVWTRVYNIGQQRTKFVAMKRQTK